MDLNKYFKDVILKKEPVDMFDMLSDAEKEESRIIAEISSKIIARRKELALSQVQLAHMLNVKQSMISQWESGNCNFTIETLAKISHALNLRINLSFIDDTGTHSSPLYSNARSCKIINIMEAA